MCLWCERFARQQAWHQDAHRFTKASQSCSCHRKPGTIGSLLQSNCEDSVIRAECLFTRFLVELEKKMFWPPIPRGGLLNIHVAGLPGMHLQTSCEIVWNEERPSTAICPIEKSFPPRYICNHRHWLCLAESPYWKRHAQKPVKQTSASAVVASRLHLADDEDRVWCSTTCGWRSASEGTCYVALAVWNSHDCCVIANRVQDSTSPRKFSMHFRIPLLFSEHNH